MTIVSLSLSISKSPLAFILYLLLATQGWGQNVSVTAKGGTTTGSYATLKAAFDAINSGTHTGSITLSIIGNTTETAPAVINASGSMTGSTPSINFNSNALGNSSLGWVTYAEANSGALIGISMNNTVATTHNINYNDFRGITYTATGTNAHTYINFTGGTAENNVSTIRSNTCSKTITNNTLNNWSGGSLPVLAMNFSYWGLGTTNVLSNNTITNITGSGTITGIQINNNASGTNTLTFANNTITNLSSTGTGGAVLGFTCSNTSSTININGNTIGELSSTGTSVTGISVSGSPKNNIVGNKIYNLSYSKTHPQPLLILS